MIKVMRDHLQQASTGTEEDFSMASVLENQFLPNRKRSLVDFNTFIKHILEPIMTEDLPRLYGMGAHKVIIHLYNARSRTSRAT